MWRILKKLSKRESVLATVAFQILPNLVGQRITEFFDIVRPIIEFKFEIVLARSNNIFEIATVEPLEVLQKVIT